MTTKITRWERSDADDRVRSLRQSAKQLEQSPRLEAQAEARRARQEADAIERYYSEGEE